MLVYVLLWIQGEIHEEEAATLQWEQESGDEDDINEEKLGNASTRPHMKKFRGLEQNKNPWSIGK
jgi:hypothetical protein